ncbi:MAG: phosphatidate cytidylyltransferase [Chlamydiales bacterium]|jgi:phosphatidate cytidylyltransferase
MDPSKRAKVWRRTRVGGTIAGVVGLLLWVSSFPVGAPLVLIVGGLLALGGILETVRMGALDLRMGLVASLVGLAGVVYFLTRQDSLGQTEALLAATSCAAAGALLAAAGRGPRAGRPSIGLPTGLLFLVALALPGLYAVRLGYGGAGLVALLVLAKAGDIAGYYVGNAIGKSHPFPNISPGKTTAGCVGSLVAGTLCGLALQLGGSFPEARWGVASGLCAGALINVAAQAGDLFESWVKRRVGIKDSGTWFGPSGGVLDLVDSFLFAVPLTWVAWPYLFQRLTDLG